MRELRKKLETLYGVEGMEYFTKIKELLAEYKRKTKKRPKKKFTEKDGMFVCYADHVTEKGEPTLKTLKKFLGKYISPYLNIVHILPFFESSGDGGFAVDDYQKIDKRYGDWRQIRSLNKEMELAVDMVLNHTSAKHIWFRKFLENDPKYRQYYISFNERVGTAGTFRPRSHPLLTEFKAKDGPRFVWTTFSENQPDLNYRNPEVLLEMIKIMLKYGEKGASIIRLDAVAYIWKEPGTSSLHRPEAHLIIKIMREVMEEAGIKILTETNVPHDDNAAYFGNGYDEANMVYNFTLPPVLAEAFFKEKANVLNGWIKDFTPPSEETYFLNFTASHDGIGTVPLEGVISEKEAMELADYAKSKGGVVSYGQSKDGQQKPYEINIVYREMFRSNEAFLSSQAIMLALKGVPMVYMNSIIGAKNWPEGVDNLNEYRAINRQKFSLKEIEKGINNPSSESFKLYWRYINLLKARINEPLFHPETDQEKVTGFSEEILGLARFKGNRRLLSITNLANRETKIDSNKIILALRANKGEELITGKSFDFKEMRVLKMGAGQTLWIRNNNGL